MTIFLHDSDKTGFPNLALMKISAWHKAKGLDVQWFDPILAGEKPEVYSSKVFSSTPRDEYLPWTAVYGGTGYADADWELSQDIEHTCPDYVLYGEDYSMGFLTRGCNRKCDWCVVPKKEGKIREHADIEEFLRHGKVVLLDNNVLACAHGIKQIEKMARIGVAVDFNQGLDARLIDATVAGLLARLRWYKPLRLSCDTVGAIPSVERAVRLLRWYNVTPRRYFVYMLVRDLDEAVERVKFLKGMDLDPFAQPYIPLNGETKPTADQKHFARWVNHKAEFKSRTWEDYEKAH